MKFIPKERPFSDAKIIKQEGSERPSWHESTSPYDINLAEALSALIKTIRTGEWRAACWFGHQLFISGPEIEAWVWLHLRSHCVEDIGLAAPEAISRIADFEETYYRCVERSERRWLVGFGAIRYLASLPKDRSNDEAYSRMIIELREGTGNIPVIPDRAFDYHIKRGKELGRGMVHFFSNATKLANDHRDGQTNEDLEFLKNRAIESDNEKQKR